MLHVNLQVQTTLFRDAGQPNRISERATVSPGPKYVNYISANPFAASFRKRNCFGSRAWSERTLPAGMLFLRGCAVFHTSMLLGSLRALIENVSDSERKRRRF